MYTCIVSSIWPQWSFGVFGINTPGELYDKNGKVFKNLIFIKIIEGYQPPCPFGESHPKKQKTVFFIEVQQFFCFCLLIPAAGH